MPTKRQAEDWVDALRVFIKDTLGNKNWQIVNKKADKTAWEFVLIIRLEFPDTIFINVRKLNSFFIQ